MRVRTVRTLAAVMLTACVGGPTQDLPAVRAPTTPLPTQRSAEVLTAVGSSTLVGVQGATAVVQVMASKIDGSPVHGVTVSFQVTAGGGSVQPFLTTTDGDGLASAKWTFGQPGVNLLTVVGGLGPSPVSFTATVAAPSASAAP